MTKSSKLQFRAATLDDIATLRRFEQGVVVAERNFTDRLIQGDIQYYDMESLVSNESALMLIASDEGTDVGCGFARIEQDKAYFEPRTHAYLGCMYVDPNWRGQGIIQALIGELFDWAEERGVNAYKLDVFARNEGAIKAYEKLGFRAEMIEMVR